MDTNKTCKSDDGTTITDANTIAYMFNNYFASVAKTLADKIPDNVPNALNYRSKYMPNSFVLFPTIMLMK